MISLAKGYLSLIIGDNKQVEEDRYDFENNKNDKYNHSLFFELIKNDTLKIDTKVYSEYMKITNIKPQGNAGEILTVYYVKHDGIVRYDTKNNVIWTRRF